MIMVWLRSTLFNIFLVVSVIPYAIVVCTVGWFLPPRARYRFTVGWPWLAIHAARLICGVRWRIEGRENLPSHPVLFLCKHQSAWETCALPFVLGREVSYVFKRELLLVPFFGWGLAMLRMIYIDRSAGAEAFRKLSEMGAERLRQGISIIIFPEGTRVPRGQAGEYRSGGARLAAMTGVDIVPIAITSARCWARNAWRKYPGEIVLRIGAPIPTQGRPYRDVSQQAQDWIESAMHELDATAYPSDATQAQ